MLNEYYTIRDLDADPGAGLLHSTPHADEVRSSLKKLKEKNPGKKIVAFKHELKKGPMGVSFKRKKMWDDTEMPELDEAAQETNKHRVSVTVSDPNHPMVSKRKDQIEKRVQVTATGRDEAKAKAEAYYKKQGLKVHDVNYHSAVSAESKYVQNGAKVPRGYEMTSHGHVVKKTKGEGTLGESTNDGIFMGATVKHKGGGVGKVVQVHDDQQVTVRDEYGNRNKVMIKDLKPHTIKESTSSFKTLMRSIQDKKSIKNTKVPAPSERNADGTMKEKKEPVKESLSNVLRYRNIVKKTKNKLSKADKETKAYDYQDMRYDDADKAMKRYNLYTHQLKRLKGMKEDLDEARERSVASQLKDWMPRVKELAKEKAKKQFKELTKKKKVNEDLDEAFDPNKKHPHGGTVMTWVNPKASGLPRYEVGFAPNKDPKNLSRGGLKTRTISGHDTLEDALEAKRAYAKKFGYQTMGESFELETEKDEHGEDVLTRKGEEQLQKYKDLQAKYKRQENIAANTKLVPTTKRSGRLGMKSSTVMTPVWNGKEAYTPPKGEVVHSVEHGGSTYNIHDTGSPRDPGRYKVRRGDTLIANHASIGNAKDWLDSHLKSKK